MGVFVVILGSYYLQFLGFAFGCWDLSGWFWCGSRLCVSKLLYFILSSVYTVYSFNESFRGYPCVKGQLLVLVCTSYHLADSMWPLLTCRWE